MIIKYADFHEEMITAYPALKRPRGNRKGNKCTYSSCVCAFDIETATNRALQVNYMYVWQFQIDEAYTIIGRTWDEFTELCSRISTALDDLTLVIYDHNLSYEWQYIRTLFDFGPEDVFATDLRRVVKCTALGNLEFRCSMMLSNMSLGQFTSTMQVEHKKLDGSDIYDKEYFPWSDLPDHVLQYSAYDVIGLVEAVKQLMRLNGDNLYTIPLTSTGFPRRDLKQAMRFYPRNKLHRCLPPLRCYEMLEEAFRGGDTHANRYYAGLILDEKSTGSRVLSADRSSSYPDVLCNCMFPMGEWKQEPASGDRLKEIMMDGSLAIVAEIRLYDVRLKNGWNGDPYIPAAKCSHIKGAIYDNGRILEAEELTITLTDIDYYIITQDYIFYGVEVLEMWSSAYDFLPDTYVRVVCDYYLQKTALKGSGRDMEYDKAKSRLNGLYGNAAMRVLKEDIIYKDGKLQYDHSKSREQLLQKAYRNASSSYAWGVWCTAWARFRLWEGIQNVGPESFVYCDTDSVKYLDAPFITWDAYNEERRKSSIYSGSLARDAKGKIHYMGVYEPDGEYKRFITLGAKRYAYEDPDGVLHITVSGVNKEKGAQELGCLENFHDGFLFQNSGKTASRYVDDPSMDYLWLKDDAGVQRSIRITPYILIEETTYYLSLTEEYKELIGLLED